MNKISSTNRDFNFDLLRSTIMFFIVIWHSIVHGLNIASNSNLIFCNFETTTSIFNYTVTKLLMYITSIGVNCFILICGHFMIDYKKSIWPRFIKIWGLTSFYSLLISSIFYLNDLTPYGLGGVIFAAFPIYNGEYWFVTQYLGLILLVPYLVKILKNVGQKEYLIGLIILSLLTINIPPIFNYGNIYSSSYNLLFFINLFCVGGYIARYNPLSRNKNLLLYFLILVFLLFGSEFMNDNTYLNMDQKLSNNSFTYISSILFFLYFKYHKFPKTKFTNLIIRYITPYTFGVYLIHENDEIRKYLWKNINLIQYYESEYFIIYLLLYSLFVFFVCILIDYFRNFISKLLQIDNFTNKYLDKISERLSNVQK